MIQTHCQQNKGLHQGGKVEGLRLAKSIAGPEPNRTCISPPYWETKGGNRRNSDELKEAADKAFQLEK